MGLDLLVSTLGRTVAGARALVNGGAAGRWLAGVAALHRWEARSKVAAMERELDVAVRAAKAAGELLVANFHRDLSVDEKQQYDIKLALDRESQELIFSILGAEFPEHALVGEEGSGGVAEALWRWVVDPIDGTVNYFYGVPHWCIIGLSILIGCKRVLLSLIPISVSVFRLPVI